MGVGGGIEPCLKSDQLDFNSVTSVSSLDISMVPKVRLHYLKHLFEFKRDIQNLKRYTYFVVIVVGGGGGSTLPQI